MVRAREWKPDWGVIDAFPRLTSMRAGASLPSWENTIAWLEDSRAAASSEFETLQPLLRDWDDALASFGGDPARDDWESFRPLRLSREEDWSDWLAFLLTGEHGTRVAMKLFPPAAPSSAVEEVVREAVVSAGDRRADLVILWSEGRASHVEVKIWDEDFAKTAETGQGCRQSFARRRDWVDYVLLPEESEPAWLASCGDDDVRVVTWGSICSEVRRELLADSRSAQWRAFARAFCGAAEQKILGAPRIGRGRPSVEGSAGVFRFGRVIREARHHGNGIGG